MVVREWIQQLQEGGKYKEEELLEFMAKLFAIFYVDNVYLASRDAGFLQHTLNILVDLFERVGLQMNMSKMQTMICMPGWIWMQPLMESYWRMLQGRVIAGEWNA